MSVKIFEEEEAITQSSVKLNLTDKLKIILE